MKTQHTPGPWKIMADPSYRTGIHPLHHHRFITTSSMGATPTDDTGEGDFDGEGTIICALRDQPNQPQDAALIAAAPDLLAALEYVVKYHREHDSGNGKLFGRDYITTSIAAIRKARGE
jgi:hypothetical protein